MQQLERDMTSFTGGGDGENSPLTLQTTPRALAAGERNASSDDDGEDVSDLPAEEAQSAVGVSITREQSRYASPKTPAAEKAAAIERAGGFFGHTSSIAEATLVEEPEEDVGDEDEDVLHERDAPTALRGPDSQRQIPPPQPNIPERSPRRTPVRLPSPWRADASSQWYQGTQARAGLFDGLFNRKRSSTGPDTPTRSFLSSLPSLPKPFSLGSTSSSVTDDNAKLRTDSAEASKRSSAQLLCFAPDDETSSPDEENARHATYEVSASPTSEHNVRSRAALLRRSASDQSLVTQRTLSRVESLGDDSRFEHVQDQVNSRLKAIKDSWQDSSMKLPSLPNIKMPNFTSDFIRDRSGSLNKRASVSLPYSTQPNGREAASKMETRPVDPMTRQPYSSTKAAMADVSPGKTSNHPNFKRALQHLEGDVVVLGGYRGSILRSADPPHRQLWVPVKVGLNLRKADLQVDFDADGDERARDRIIADGMLTHIGPVDIARRLFKRLRSCKNAQSGKLRVHDYGYDWRLDPSYLSRQLISFLEKLPCNRPGVSKDKNGATVIAHSLGGIITRHAVNARPELFKGVVYAGVPTTCVNILGPMRNGDEVLLSNRVLTAQVNFSIRTSFVLLPLDGRCFFNKQTREEYPVDFFDPETWIDLRLSPCVGRPLPALNADPKPTGITGYVSSMTSALPSVSLPGWTQNLKSKASLDSTKVAAIRGAAEPDMAQGAMTKDNIARGVDETPSVATNVSISREQAIEYLTRTLASVKKFKEELAFNHEHAASNAYPPMAVIYGKSTPTVYGAKVDSKEAIKRADAYDQLAFASGDGVVLARAAMVPEGYTTARGGVISSERGHVTLLSDLEAVGKCLNAIMAARRKGVGLYS